jgi:preprotein translocase subunit SecY
VKKKFVIHFDALLVLVLLFIMLLGLVIFQQSQVSKITLENQKLQWQSVEDSFNLDSQTTYINKLQKQLAEEVKE